MAYIQLEGGSYKSRALISAAQRCLNLYPEVMPSRMGEASPVAHLCTPGLTLLSTAPLYPIRNLYTASNGDLYGVCDDRVCYIDRNWNWNTVINLVGTASTDVVARRTPMSISDNGTTIFLVDGSVDGWLINMATRVGSRIDRSVQTAFLGGDKVDFTDTFFVLNQPGTPNIYCSLSESTDFDALDFTGKSAKADNVVSLIVEHRVLWIFGVYTTEIFFNSGGGGSGALANNTFPFEAMPGTFFPRGLAAKYSLARADNQICWLSQDLNGNGVVMRGLGYNAMRMSTHAMEAEFSTYSRIDDAIGFCYNMQGHTWYWLSFPTADKTWVADITNPQTVEWHERCWLDPDSGQEKRHRANCHTFAYGLNLVGDHEEGSLYHLDTANFTDAGNPIKRLVCFPHQIDADQNRRVMFRRFVANMQTGTGSSGATPQTVIKCSFNASDGTDLENYVPTGDVGSTWTKLGAHEGKIVSDAFIGDGGGAVLYLASGLPTTSNYSLTFKAEPNSFVAVPPSGQTLYAIGRANGSHNGYQAMVSSDAFQFHLILNVMGTATTVNVPMGTLTTGQYFNVTLGMSGDTVQVMVLKSDDTFLSAAGTWVSQLTQAISITDTTYTQPGRVLIGGNWGG